MRCWPHPRRNWRLAAPYVPCWRGHCIAKCDQISADWRPFSRTRRSDAPQRTGSGNGIFLFIGALDLGNPVASPANPLPDTRGTPYCVAFFCQPKTLVQCSWFAAMGSRRSWLQGWNPSSSGASILTTRSLASVWWSELLDSCNRIQHGWH